MEEGLPAIRIGTAGWALPREWQGNFGGDGSHLERYATRFSCVEINSSFYKAHRRSTYERWAASVPAGFRFAVKVPRAITHDQALVASDVLLSVFLEEVTGLGRQLGPLLVQLPGSQPYDAGRVGEFFETLRGLHAGVVVCEPRHPGWFAAEADDLLARYGIVRAAADPARVPRAACPGGSCDFAYYRLHGSPHMYRSSYDDSFLARLASMLSASEHAAGIWCTFDNTTLGAATGNALRLQHHLRITTGEDTRASCVPGLDVG